MIKVIGCGNPWASDDGVGIEIVRRLQEEGQPGVELVEVAQAGVELVDLLAGCDKVILIDAVRSGARPGTLHRLEWAPGVLDSRRVERSSSHGFGVREALELAAVLGKLPERVSIWGITIASAAPGVGLSPGVSAELPGIVAQLCTELAQLLVTSDHTGSDGR